MKSVGDGVFHDYVALYQDAVSVTRYHELDALQPAPFATLSQGGAGTAYVLWRLGHARRASMWIAAALADRRAGAHVDSQPGMRRSSHLFGRGGVRWVDALVASRAKRRAAIDAYVRTLQRSAGLRDLASGTAGHLAGAIVLLRRAPDPALARVAASLAGVLEAEVRARIETPWRPDDATGLAHRWPGLLWALLAYGELRDEPVAPWLAATLVELAGQWARDSMPDMELVASWCNGSAGMAMLWAKAFARTGEPRLLEVAARAAHAAIADSGSAQTLCCGDGGIAFALLALDRVDPDHGWRERARTMAARAIARASLRWPCGLLQGHPGLVCLALDCIAERPLGFPGLET